MSRLINYIGGLLLLAVLALGFLAYHEHNRAIKAQAAADDAKAVTIAATTYAKVTKTNAKHKEARAHDVQAALSASPAWADEPVPDAIADQLREKANPAK